MTKKIFTLLKVFMTLCLLLVSFGNAWGESTVLFHETFGNNTGSARVWSDTYSVKSGVSDVYSGVSYTMTNVKQGKNTTGYTQSGLNQSVQATDAVFEFGPLDVSNYKDLSLSYYWKAASISKTYSTQIYYKTSKDGSYTGVSHSASGATSFVPVSVDLPEVANKVSTLYLKIVFNTSNTQAIIDEVELTGTLDATGTDPILSVSPATIDFGEVYQNAEIDAKEVTVSFANLTTNDVAAAISGSIFGIDKTGSFTSGDKIIITPNTATIGEYEETLTISATGIDEQKVTVTMNVVPAPVTKNYTIVTDASTLKAGDIIVIGATKDNKSYVAGALDGKYLSSGEAQVNDGILSASGGTEFTLGGEADSWTLTSTAGTLGATTAGNLTFDGTKDNFVGTWTISIDEDNNAIISSTNEGYGRFLYNVNNPRFLTYTSNTSASMLLPKIYRKVVNATITSTGYATFSSDCALDLSNLPEGLTAYKATTANNGQVHMVAVEEAVAASTGLFLKGTENATYTIPVAASGNALEGNLLKATTGGEVEAGDYVYVIASGAFQPLANNTVVSKGKAYIPASAITTSGKLEISFGEPTGITSYENENFKAMTVYNLQGVRVNNSYKGIVIMNGKKYINK